MGCMLLLLLFFQAHAHTLLRKLRTEHSGIIVLWFQCGSGILAILACLLTIGTIPIPANHLWLPLIGVGLMATLGQLLMTLTNARQRQAVATAPMLDR